MRPSSIAVLGLAILAVTTSSGCAGLGRTDAVRQDAVAAPDGVDIVYDDRGNGDVALVFVHCWSCDRSFWREQLDDFADEYRVVSLDLAGHGASGRVRDGWSIAGLAGDVEAVVSALDLRRVILVGHSMGGPVSLVAARNMPDRVIGLIAVDTLHDAEFAVPSDAAEGMASGFAQDFAGTMAGMIGAMFPEGTDPELIADVLARAQRADADAAVALMRDFANVELAEWMSAAGVPIRAINASPRPPMGPPTAFQTNRKYADFDAVLMDGVGHYLMLERPEEFNRHLRTYAAELAQR